MAKDMLEKELLCGIKIDDFGRKSGNIIDKLNDPSEGYSFIHNKLNGFWKHCWKRSRKTHKLRRGSCIVETNC